MAMPETVLGLFPDVGGTWFLNRCPGAIGRYLALTGVSIGAADALMAGLATHHVPYAAFDGLVSALGAADRLDAAVVGEIIDAHAVIPNGGRLAERKEDIARLFGDDDLDVVVAAVDAAASNRSEEHTSELQSLMRISYA